MKYQAGQSGNVGGRSKGACGGRALALAGMDWASCRSGACSAAATPPEGGGRNRGVFGIVGAAATPTPLRGGGRRNRGRGGRAEAVSVLPLSLRNGGDRGEALLSRRYLRRMPPAICGPTRAFGFANASAR